MSKKHTGGGAVTPPATLTLQQSGQTFALTRPDLYRLALGTISIPNAALEDILALHHYRVLLAHGDSESDLDRLKRLTVAQFELFRLCVPDARLVLEGDAAPGDLTPADLTSADLDAVLTFFQTGGSRGVPAATDYGSHAGTPTDRAGAALADDAGEPAGP